MRTDRTLMWLSIGLFVLSLVLPLGLFLAGWAYRDIQTGLILGGISLVLCLGGALFAIFKIENLSVFSSSLPYLFGTIYAFLPDAFFGPFDDGAILGIGAAFTFMLEHRRNPNASKWAFVFPALSLLYVFVGTLIPGSFDELIVGGILYAGYLYVNARESKSGNIIQS
ncbi:MAG: hypothetical protein ACK2UW_21240 [Anaerolineales bacterium]